MVLRLELLGSTISCRQTSTPSDSGYSSEGDNLSHDLRNIVLSPWSQDRPSSHYFVLPIQFHWGHPVPILFPRLRDSFFVVKDCDADKNRKQKNSRKFMGMGPCER